MDPAIPKIIIGHGQVGKALAQAYLAHGSKIWRTSRKGSADGAGGSFYLNLAEPESIRMFFAKFQEKYVLSTRVFLTAAFTNVDGCEREPEHCRQINAEGPQRVAEECLRYGHHLVFFSSEYVFGGAEYEGGAVGPFTEEDPVFPTCVYGQSKVDAERALLALSSRLRVTIVRTTMVFSWDRNDMNFPMQVYRYLADYFAGKSTDTTKKFRVPLDQVSTPTYAPALAAATLYLAEKALTGIYHLVGEDRLSRAEFVRKLIECFGFPVQESLARFDFLPTLSLGQAARRPLNAGLSADKAKRVGVPINNLRDAFQEFKI